jgi:hypothetical protein
MHLRVVHGNDRVGQRHLIFDNARRVFLVLFSSFHLRLIGVVTV